MIDINEIQPGDVFSERSYYSAVKFDGDNLVLKMVGKDEEVNLSKSYVEKFLTSSDQYQNEVKIGKLDKLWTAKKIAEASKKGNLPADAVEGSLQQEGIKTIWSKIGTEVITVCFVKKGTELSDKAYNQMVDLKVAEVLEEIEAVKNSKKGVANKATELLKEIIKNPISREVKGESRILRGYKVQFESEDGFYQMMEILQDGTTQLRPVNLNTIEWVVVNGTKYVVE